MKRGIHFDMQFDEYAAAEGLNPSKLKQGRTSMRHMQHAIDNPKPPTDAMRKGTNIHSAVLESERFAASIAVADGVKSKRVKAWHEFKDEAEGAGLIALLQSEADELQSIYESVWRNKRARDLIETTRHEVSLFWEDAILGKCKTRLDGLNEGRGMILEVKSSAAIDPWSFAATQYRMGTHLQAGWGRWGAQTLLNGGISAYYVLAIEQAAPYDCAVYEASMGFLDKGIDEARDIGRRYRIAQELSDYQGVDGGDLLQLELPGWVGKDDETWTVGE